MVPVGGRIDETGMLLRESGGFVLQRDHGGRWSLDLHRTPVDMIEKRVRVRGVHVGGGLQRLFDTVRGLEALKSSGGPA